jgi:hypothetical protein
VAVDLSNYYTKTELQTAGSAIVDFANIVNTDFIDSIEQDSSGVHLVGDLDSPGINKVYGTDGSGIKGWYASSGGSSLWAADSIGDLYTVTYGAGVYIGTSFIKDNYFLSETEDLIIKTTNSHYIYLAASGLNGNSVIIIGDNSELPIPGQNLVIIQTPPASANNPDGAGLYLYSSEGYSTGGKGGEICFYAGTGYGFNPGGNIVFYAGGSSDTGAGGFLSFIAGDGIEKGGGIEIRTGNCDSNTNLAGDLLIFTGINNAGTRGGIYLGNRDSFGALPAKTSETNIVYYNPSTGKLSYGAK